MSIIVFGNHINPVINLRYMAHRLIRFVIGKPAAISSQAPGHAFHANQLQHTGYTQIQPFIPGPDIHKLQTRLDHLFQSSDSVVESLRDGGLLRLKNCLVQLPELEEFLSNPNVSGVFHQYFGSHFQVYSCDVYRTFPSPHPNTEEIFPSLLWHFDNCPSSVIKVMIYLRNTTTETGALTIINKSTSRKLRKQGFWDRNNIERYSTELENNTVKLEGPAGTVLIFSTHHCIHKATLPTTGLRDVAVFLLQPSLSSTMPWSDAQRQSYSHNFGYCVNPFTNQPLRVADE